MLAQMMPYTPSLYRPDSYGRYRIYPRVTETPIPGAGFKVGSMYWGEQELNLDGSNKPQPYGNYSMVPLRGLGAFPLNIQLPPAQLRLQLKLDPAPPPPVLDDGSGGGESPAEHSPEDFASPSDFGYDVGAEIAAAAAAAEAAAASAAQSQAAIEPEGFLSKKVGPVPYWALGLGGLAVIGGGAWFMMRRKKVSPNRRRRR